MKQVILNVLALMGLFMTAACIPGEGEFEAGEWQLEGWMEHEGSSQRLEAHQYDARVSDQLAMMDARVVMFSEFYHSTDPSNVRFEDGVISGYLNQRAVAPFPEHQQEVTGWYRSDAFEMRIKMPPIGNFQTYQVVRGSLVVTS